MHKRNHRQRILASMIALSSNVQRAFQLILDLHESESASSSLRLSRNGVLKREAALGCMIEVVRLNAVLLKDAFVAESEPRSRVDKTIKLDEEYTNELGKLAIALAERSYKLHDHDYDSDGEERLSCYLSEEDRYQVEDEET